MKQLFFLTLMLMLSFPPILAQDNYYLRQAKSYMNDADYYNRQAAGYERDADYYNRQAQNYLRDVD